jgi:hypothetical protein
MKFSLTIASDDPADILAFLSPSAASTYVRAVEHGPSVEIDASVPPAAVITGALEPRPEIVAEPAEPDVDARGFPWDERIHAGGKSLNKDGSWRYRRGTDEATIKQVEAELRDGSTPARATGGVLPPSPPAAMPDAPEATAPAAALPFPPAAGGMPPIPAFLQRAAPVENVTYGQVISKLTEAFNKKLIDQHDLPQFWANLGVAGVDQLEGNQPKLNEAYQAACALLATAA